MAFVLALAPSFLALCALGVWPGGAGRCSAALAPGGSIWGARSFLCLTSGLLAALTLGAAPPCRGAVAPPSSGSSGACASAVGSGPPSAGAALLPRPRLRASYPPSAHLVSPSPALPPPSLAPGCASAPPASSPPPDSLGVLRWGAGGLRAGGTGLLHFLSSHPVDLVCIRGPGLGSSSSFRIPGFSVLRSGRARSRSGVLSSGASHAGGGVVVFVGRGLSFSGLSAASLSSLGPCSDCVGVGISLDGSSSVSFLNVCAPPVRSSPADGRTDSFSPSILPSSRNLFILGDFNCHHPLWDSGGTSDPRGEEVFDWVVSSDLLPLSDPDAPTLFHRSSGGRSSPGISFAPSALAFSCSWGVLQDLGSDHLPILLSIPLSPVFRPSERPPSFGFRKARWDDFASYFDSRCPAAGECWSLSLSSAAALFASLAVNAAKSSIPFGRIKRPPGAWWSAGVEGTVGGGRRTFAAAHGGDGDRRTCISASRRASSVIAGAGAGAWRTTCTSLSPRSGPRSVHSLLRSIAGSPSSSSSSPGFPGCSSPRESASVCAACLGSHFSVSQPGAASLSSAELRALWSLARPFALPSLPLSFLRLPPASPHPLPLAQTKLPVPCWGVFLALAWIFFFASLVFLGLRIPFLPSGGHLLLFPCMGWEGLSALLLPSGLSLSPPACQSFLDASCYPVFSFSGVWFRSLSPPGRFPPWTVCT